MGPQAPGSPRLSYPRAPSRHLLGRVGLVYAVSQLEFVGLAPMQGRETREQVDQLSGGRWRGPRGLQLVLPPHGRRCARRRCGGDDIGGAWRGADRVPLPGRWGQGTVARLQGRWRAQARVGVHGEPVHVGVHGGPGGGAGVTVLDTLGLDPGALGEVGADPRGWLRGAHRAVLLPRLRGGPLDGPVLFGKVAP